jgi:hypothetical protein
MLAILAAALLRLRQFKSILITHQSIIGDSSITLDFLEKVGKVGVRSRRVWTPSRSPHFPGRPRLGMGLARTGVVLNITPPILLISKQMTGRFPMLESDRLWLCAVCEQCVVANYRTLASRHPSLHHSGRSNSCQEWFLGFHKVIR